jgi:hypothetical protein
MPLRRSQGVSIGRQGRGLARCGNGARGQWLTLARQNYPADATTSPITPGTLSDMGTIRRPCDAPKLVRIMLVIVPGQPYSRHEGLALLGQGPNSCFPWGWGQPPPTSSAAAPTCVRNAPHFLVVALNRKRVRRDNVMDAHPRPLRPGLSAPPTPQRGAWPPYWRIGDPKGNFPAKRQVARIGCRRIRPELPNPPTLTHPAPLAPGFMSEFNSNYDGMRRRQRPGSWGRTTIRATLHEAVPLSWPLRACRPTSHALNLDL